MKYVIVEFGGTTPHIEAITEDPINYVSRFEPIDVLNGKCLAWDELGVLYKFGPEKKLNESKISKNVSIVDVGSWADDEPKLIKVTELDEEGLRKILVTYLEQMKNRRPKLQRLFFKKATSPIVKDYATMSNKELISLIEKNMS